MSTENNAHPFGKSISVMKFGEGNQFIIDNAALDTMFLHPEVKNRKTVVFSIIGAYRKGKSFFLDYCLRYLYATYPSVANPHFRTKSNENWMGGENDPLQGFSWRVGANRDTTGIIMWSDVFLHTVETTGEKIAIVLMDTQGLFDSEMSPADNSRIFALGTLLSSVQIMNLVGVIQEDQLQYLQFATEFAKFASQDNPDSGNKPFQNLVFLIRDWNSPDDYKFGTEGGQLYLQNILKLREGQKPELKSVRQFISSSFQKISCCLLPHPGKTVARIKGYNGNWKEMEAEFKEELTNIIKELLCSENLVVKRVDSNYLNGSEVKDYIATYLKLFQSDELPPTQTIYESTIERQMTLLIEKCLSSYKEIIYINRDLMNRENLHVFHELSMSEAMAIFNDEKKMGNSDHAKKYKVKLEKQLEEYYKQWKNDAAENAEKMESEKRKIEEAYQEKIRLEQQALEAERMIKEKQFELEKQKLHNLIEQEKYDAEKKILELRLQAEQERAKASENEREKERALRELLEEKLKKMPPSTGMPPLLCQIM